jgi:PAS domain S-box-containing protein
LGKDGAIVEPSAATGRYARVIPKRRIVELPDARGPKAAVIVGLAMLLAVLWAGLFFHLSIERRLEVDHAGQTTDNLTRIYAEQILSTLRGVDQTLLLLKQVHELREIMFNPSFALSSGVLLKGADLRVQVAGADGFTIYSSDKPAYVGDRDYFRTHAAADSGRLFIGNSEFPTPDGEPVMALSRRLNRPDGSFDGVVAISFNPLFLRPALTTLGTGAPVTMAVVGLDRAIRVVTDPLPFAFGRTGELLNAPALLQERERAPNAVHVRPSVVDGINRIVAWRTLDDYPLFVFSAIPVDEILTSFNRARIALIAAMAAISCFFVLGAMMLLRSLEQRAALSTSVRTQAQQLRAIMDNAPFEIFIKDRQGRYVAASRHSEDLRGIPSENLIGQTDAELSPKMAALSHDSDAEVLEFGRIAHVEREPLTPRTGLEQVEIVKFPIFAEDETIEGLCGFAFNITERKAAERVVREQERQLRAIMDNAPVAIFLKDRERRHLAINRQYEEWFQFSPEQLIGHSDDELDPEVAALSRESDAEALEHGRISRVERAALRAVPGLDFIEIIKFPIFAEDGAIVGLSGFIFNISERRRMEEQLRQAAKMEAVGRLAGGIAHDFNNMIGAIVGFNSFLLEDLDAATPQHRFATRIAQVCEQAKRVVRQVVAFSRAGEVDKKVIDLRAAISEDEAVLRGALPASTTLTIDVGTTPLPVLINEGQVAQMLLNLCVNASDAMGGAPGSVALRIERIDADHPDHQRFADTTRHADVARATGGALDREHSYCAVRVSDTGCGMNQATVDRIFEPFFTTKGPGRGTGLGLAVIHGIVTAYDGAYLVNSTRGRGSEFVLYLPLADAAEVVPAVPAADQGLTGSESLLIVDDEVDMTDMLSIGLERLGYDVTCSNDPVEALRGFEEDTDAWDVVIADRTMPTMTGTALIERIKALRPNCPALLYTGFADAMAARTAPGKAGADAVLLKPIEPRRVAAKVRELLDRRVATTGSATIVKLS